MSPNGLLSGFRFMIILRQPINTNEDAGARAAGHNGAHNRAAGAEAVPDRSAGARNSADAADSGDDSGHNDDDGRYR